MNRARQQQRSAPATLDDVWRRWIAENLLLGASKEAVLRRLVERGCPFLLARQEVELALDSPYLAGAQLLQARLAKRDWLLASRARLEAMEGDAPLQRRPASSAERFFHDHYVAGRPALLTGLIDHWPARRLWSLDYFAERLGDPEVEVQVGRESDAEYELRSPEHKQLMPFRQLLAMLRDDPTTNDFYVTANNCGHNRRALGALWDDIGDMPGFLVPRANRDGFFWMGPRGTVTPWHHDLTNNFLVQIQGRKRVHLVSASQTPLMRNIRHCYSAFAGSTDFSSVPLSERPNVLECVLEPGDTLFIPVGWWHHVEGLDMTISMSFTNFAWDNDFSSFYGSYGPL